MNKFRDWCENCKKEVEITELNMLTAAATCENGHIWWSGEKYKFVRSGSDKPFEKYKMENI